MSKALRITGLRVLPSREETLRVLENSPSTTIWRLSSTPESVVTSWYSTTRPFSLIGSVLVMASRPSYDINIWVPTISQKDFDLLRNDDSKPMYGRAFQAAATDRLRR